MHRSGPRLLMPILLGVALAMLVAATAAARFAAGEYGGRAAKKQTIFVRVVKTNISSEGCRERCGAAEWSIRVRCSDGTLRLVHQGVSGSAPIRNGAFSHTFLAAYGGHPKVSGTVSGTTMTVTVTIPKSRIVNVRPTGLKCHGKTTFHAKRMASSPYG